MRFHVLATDYDGTIAHDGVVDAATQEALARVRDTGRKLVLVTGRQLDDLQRVFPDLERFDAIVAENGAVVHQPGKRLTRLLGERPPDVFVETLRARGLTPSVGQVIVGTWQPHEAVVLDTIRDLGLELQVIFNKGAVMVLPSGINKATGLRVALEELGLSHHNAVGVGDAENDHAFLGMCECSVAVANALPSLKERADLVTQRDHGAGVQELVEHLVSSDLAVVAQRLERHSLILGDDDEGQPVRIPAYSPPVLVSGTSGGGKSTLATALIEQLAEQAYQFCIIDPEGDFGELTGITALGDPTHAPPINEVLEVMASPTQGASVNMLGLPLADRPGFFESLLFHLQEIRARAGRPHWLVIDEAHHLLPQSRPPALVLPRELVGLLLITVHPDHVSAAVLDDVALVVAIGADPLGTLTSFANAVGTSPPSIPDGPLGPGEGLAWFRRTGAGPIRFQARAPHTERRRHVRKYAAGSLGPDKSFFFRGPEEKLNLRAQNLQLFIQVADGVDDETWLHHLRRGDYSRWFREAIKDEGLADEVAAIEADQTLDPAASRARIRAAVESRYTAAA